MDLYAENILEHFKHPQGKKNVKNPDSEHEEVNASCGDTLIVQLTIKKNMITDIGWSGSGCAVSQAGMSLLSEKIAGMSLTEAAKLSVADMRTLLGVPVSARRLKCAMLPLLALHNTLRAWKKEPLLTWAELLEENMQ